MASLQALLVSICAVTTTVLAIPTTRSTSPIVALGGGEFIGTTSDGVNRFLGIPFLLVGDLRLCLPQALGPYSGTHNATAFGLSCPQQATTLMIPNRLPQEAADFHGSKLPVVGSFATGSSSLEALNEPVVYVSLNYRWTINALLAFGLLASQEVKDAGVSNLGLHDLGIMVLRWIQKYNYAFGGDSSKVTIWGQSAGSVSVSLQMLTNGGNTEGLFRAAFMQSGMPSPIGDITHGQRYYDDLVVRTGCSDSSDTLACLWAAPYDELKAAMDSSQLIATYNSLALVWQKLAQQGSIASIPFVTGDCDDEGTLFALSQLNDRRGLAQSFIRILPAKMQNATDAELDELLTLYPQDDTQGSPYDTGTQDAFTPQFKRIASILGNSVFQAPRRFFLNNVSDKQNTGAFLSKRLKWMPVLGELTDYLIHFATHLDPNGGSSPQWSQYTTSLPQLMTLLESSVTNTTTTLDTYRVDEISLLTELWLAHSL
ncbi:carotenoid ester lipase precursor [Lactarius akahatsu]|uniref:Carboxylic ester hydrolase n=1 Tax=Lactarius akahatsu TaxID=416441 RepID=A0AAD4QBC6_9AGAM|nr:carotenoid ester lipase precursor [Lactarius akahatsu]